MIKDIMFELFFQSSFLIFSSKAISKSIIDDCCSQFDNLPINSCFYSSAMKSKEKEYLNNKKFVGEVHIIKIHQSLLLKEKNISDTKI